MIPLRDDIPTHCVPWVNYTIIVVCVLVFIVEFVSPDHGERLIYQYGMIPAHVSGHKAPPQATPRVEAAFIPAPSLPPQPAVSPWLTMLTCMFLHGGLMHLVGNMLFLYIFGDNIEDRYGHLGYLLMYLGCGIVAGVLHLASAPASEIPTIGASGAIAGVMGSYLVMFRHARVMTLIPLGIFTQIVAVPAPFFLVLWFVVQLVSATGSQSDGAGVAFWAHVGGFVAGTVLTWLLYQTRTITAGDTRRHVRAWDRRQLPWS